jgi:hypothetical protein
MRDWLATDAALPHWAEQVVSYSALLHLPARQGCYKASAEVCVELHEPAQQ